MSLWHIAWNYLWNRKLTTFLTIASVALGVGLIATVLTLEDETRRRFEEEGKVFDIVAGAKGSPLQLVLSSVYFMDKPTGNIRYSDYVELKNDPDVASAYPITLGDTRDGFRIIGTVPEIIDYTWTDTRGNTRRPFVLQEGSRFFEKPMEAVLGSVVANQLGLKVGDTFKGVHGVNGYEHDEMPYTVVGLLKPGGTPMDRGIFTAIESTYEIHADEQDASPLGGGDEGEEGLLHGFARVGGQVDLLRDGKSVVSKTMDPQKDGSLTWALPTDVTGGVPYRISVRQAETKKDNDITAVLISLHTPALQFQFQDKVNRNFNAMAASPINEIATFYRQFLGTAQTVLITVGFLVVVISALSIMIGLYLSIYQRKRDLAIMRALGASAGEIFGAILVEAFLVTLLGIAAGWILGSLVAASVGIYLTQTFGMIITPFALPTLVMRAFSIIALVGLVAGILPAYQAYRTDVAKDLAAV